MASNIFIKLNLTNTFKVTILSSVYFQSINTTEKEFHSVSLAAVKIYLGLYSDVL